MLAEAINSKPILLRGLGDFQLPVIAVEIGFIFGAALVIGIGISFIVWLMKYEPTAERWLNGSIDYHRCENNPSKPGT